MLMIGSTISHYKILEKLGEGGMGVVYKAQDTKLDRLVALKFLPQHVSASDQDKARFIQEAKAAAALNHPNICTIYGVEESSFVPQGGTSADGREGQMFIEMEFVEGQTLRDKGMNVPLKQSIEIGIQLADGLAAAHEKGIVHRDIKPENIMLQKDGRVRIMDFGLAKLKSATRLTKAGSTVGTTGYMSPEQVQGMESDHRSDIFSLGVILYELFSGQSPFKGVHETAINYEIVNVDPDPISTVKPDIAPELDGVILECLAKEQSERYQSVAEVAKELRRYKRESSRTRVTRVSAVYRPSGIQTSPMAEAPEFSQPKKLFTLERIGWMAAVVLLLAGALVLSLTHFREVSPEVRTFRATILPPEKASFLPGNLAVSPDGRLVTFVGRDSTGKTLLWVRPLSAISGQPLAGTDEASFPFWSPDSRFIGFFAGGKLKKIEAAGSPPQIICDAATGRGGTWGSSGVIVFNASANVPLSRVPAAGGMPTVMTRLDSSRREISHRWPSFLPDGKHFFYISRTATGTSSETDAIYLSSLDSSDRNRLLVHASSNMMFVSGHLLFLREQTLMAQPFDTGHYELRSEAFPIGENIQYEPNTSKGAFSASNNGVLIYQTGTALGGWRLEWFDRNGKQMSSITRSGVFFSPSLSPDGKKMAIDISESQSRNTDIWLYELGRDVWTRFTFDPSVDRNPVWSPDGNQILFSSERKGQNDLYRRPASGASSEELLFETKFGKVPSDWSRDGKYILFFSTADPKTKTDLWVLPLTGDRKPIDFLHTEFNELRGVFSPDGKWIAYQSDESGKYQIYARPFPGPGGKWQISVNGGTRPRWSRDGKEIFFIPDDGKLAAAEVKWKGMTFEVGVVRPLFDARYAFFGGGASTYDVTADGRRFLINTLLGQSVTTPLTVVINWDAELHPVR
jgi:serine/threonine protein kinase